MTHTTDAAPAGAALAVHPDDPDIRILRRVIALKDFPLAPPTDGPVRFVTVIDTETTGTDPMHDEIIDIALVTLEVDAAGEIVGIVSSGQALRDPRMPIPPYITRLTGITDADVRGRIIDLDRLEHRLSKADVLVAHNAMFDIAFIENLMPGIAGAAWACSANDFDWLEAGLDGRKLGHLLMQIGRFNNAHRAMADVVSLIHLLAHRLPHGGTVIGALLANAAKPTIRFEATGASFDRRSALKARGYRWDPRQKVWWCELAEDECAAEERWFRQHIAPHGPVPRMLPITWHQRHR
ncbi:MULTISPECIES: 3'-5' exonuclease [Sphingomonas]|jgi:DNA polymerase-3 subunit epsilon|uniref:DNA polymerase III subunit epsilon n=1 Tax=Sphingomonas hankookensis TaxID=563996 RepID=A0ABR5Y955_9SPHN|nr:MULTISPECIES: 3'-5' exonuclease [Sphingomonas]KZE11220.1 DNA polymerase III subunit epsilon [Sphingomonas hankookensis]PZT95079.1 MAG: DNA polymerase III subunit epsilon [Sphingomonas sp.]WCP73382.1 3'-5' exonuclease [Sphingomonas hankookensis]